MPQFVNKITFYCLKLAVVVFVLLPIVLINNSYAETAATTQPGATNSNGENKIKQSRTSVKKKKANRKVKPTADAPPKEVQAKDNNEPEILNLTVKPKRFNTEFLHSE
jgi:hypothetical protein